jgi:uncharacterized protein
MKKMDIQAIINSLSQTQWIILSLSALLIGLAKTGMNGLNLPAIVALAFFFDGKTSTGIVLPMLIAADFIGVSYYIKSTNWKYIFILLPYTLLGIIAALFVGKNISNDLFNIIMSILIIIALVIMLYREKNNNGEIPVHWSFSLVLGFLGGFATMIGNVAGPLMAIYLLSMKLPKNNYIATAAVFFALINIIKLPFHIFFWNTVNMKSITLDAMIIPFIAIGAGIGIFIIKKIPEKSFKYFIISLTGFSALCLLVKSFILK